jgi:hypothetical protein
VLENEVILLDHYFDKRTLHPLINALEEVLIKDHHNEILENGFPTLLKEGKLEVLTLVFSFFNETKLLPSLRQAWI